MLSGIAIATLLSVPALPRIAVRGNAPEADSTHMLPPLSRGSFMRPLTARLSRHCHAKL
jgi:hypothetical protein